MANFTKTITNSINCFGNASTQKWGSSGLYPMVWGSSFWGENRVLTQFSFGITVTNTVALDSLIYSKDFKKALANTFDFVFSPSDEELSESKGYYKVFPRPDTNAENRSLPTYTEINATSPTYTKVTATTAVWS